MSSYKSNNNPEAMRKAQILTNSKTPIWLPNEEEAAKKATPTMESVDLPHTPDTPAAKSNNPDIQAFLNASNDYTNAKTKYNALVMNNRAPRYNSNSISDASYGDTPFKSEKEMAELKENVKNLEMKSYEALASISDNVKNWSNDDYLNVTNAVCKQVFNDNCKNIVADYVKLADIYSAEKSIKVQFDMFENSVAEEQQKLERIVGDGDINKTIHAISSLTKNMRQKQICIAEATPAIKSQLLSGNEIDKIVDFSMDLIKDNNPTYRINYPNLAKQWVNTHDDTTLRTELRTQAISTVQDAYAATQCITSVYKDVNRLNDKDVLLNTQNLSIAKTISDMSKNLEIRLGIENPELRIAIAAGIMKDQISNENEKLRENGEFNTIAANQTAISNFTAISKTAIEKIKVNTLSPTDWKAYVDMQESKIAKDIENDFAVRGTTHNLTKNNKEALNDLCLESIKDMPDKDAAEMVADSLTKGKNRTAIERMTQNLRENPKYKDYVPDASTLSELTQKTLAELKTAEPPRPDINVGKFTENTATFTEFTDRIAEYNKKIFEKAVTSNKFGNLNLTETNTDDFNKNDTDDFEL